MTQHFDALDLIGIALCILVIAAAVIVCINDYKSSRNRIHNLPRPQPDSRSSIEYFKKMHTP